MWQTRPEMWSQTDLGKHDTTVCSRHRLTLAILVTWNILTTRFVVEQLCLSLEEETVHFLPYILLMFKYEAYFL